jgi:hypothetical protein
MLKIILIALALLFVVLIILVVRQPDEFRITRTATLPAPASLVFTHVNDLHKWNAWSPWAKLDPNAKNTFEGSDAGTGAIMHWAGNNEVGEGSMTITESRANELIRFKLEFLKPMKATNTTEFTFTPQGDQTLLSWSMFGENNFIGKAIGLVMNCEKMVGDQFEQGLDNLKLVLEKEKN